MQRREFITLVRGGVAARGTHAAPGKNVQIGSPILAGRRRYQ
jgi:hypothetical protein